MYEKEDCRVTGNTDVYRNDNREGLCYGSG